MTTVDGAPSIRVRANGGFTMGMQNADTVDEVQVLTTNYQAEYGRASAGLLRLVTKSGTQQFRGNVFWSGQDDALNANTWTNNRAGIPKSPVSFNQYGFTPAVRSMYPAASTPAARSCSSSGARNGTAFARLKTSRPRYRHWPCATATSASC